MSEPLPEQAERRHGRPSNDDMAKLPGELLASARAVFLARGYAAATMSEIAAHARASKRTFYSRYPNKAALFEAAISDFMSRTMAPISEIRASCSDVGEQLMTVGRVFLAASTDREVMAIHRLVMAEAMNFPALVTRLHQGGFERGTSLVFELLSAAGARQPAIASSAFYALLVLTPMQTITDEPPAIPDLRDVVDFILAGLHTDRSTKA